MTSSISDRYLKISVPLISSLSFPLTSY